MPLLVSAENFAEEWTTVGVSEKYYRTVNYSNDLVKSNIISCQEVTKGDY